MTRPATMPGLLLRNAAAMPAYPAFRQRRHGIWQTLSWPELAQLVRRFALGLAAGGFGRGTRVAIIGENRPRLYAAALAAQSLGSAVLPLHPDTDPATLERVLVELRATVAVAESAEQAARLIALAERAPDLALIIQDRLAPGRQQHAKLREFDAVLAAGDEIAARTPGRFEREASRGRADDPAFLLARGEEVTHAMLMEAATAITARERIRPNDLGFCYLPICSLGDMVYSLALGLEAGFAGHCPEAPHTVSRDIREIGPTLMLATPRVLELMAAHVAERALAATGLKRLAFTHFRAAAIQAERLRAAKAHIPAVLGLWRRIGALCIDTPLRDQLGLRRTRFVHIGPGEPDLEIACLFRSMGFALHPAIGVDPAALTGAAAHNLTHV